MTEAVIKKCIVCEKDVYLQKDKYTKHYGHKYYIYCEDCKKFQCIRCLGLLDNCLTCNKLFCVGCDDGEMLTDYGGDTYHCKKHRDLNVTDLYEYMVKTYNVKVTLTELRNIMLG